MADITFYKNIPFDPDGSYTMDFLNSSGAFDNGTRESYLNASSHLYASISEGISDVFIRENVAFKVPYNIDALRNAGVNYFKFRNKLPDNTGYGRYYFGFIDKMTLSSADTTVIDWHLDPLQTYLSEIYSDTRQQNVERCHQDRFNSSMRPIFNTMPDMPAGEQKTKALRTITTGEVGYCVLVCSSQLDQFSFDNSPRLAPPDIVQNCPNSFFHYIFPVPKDVTGSTNHFYSANNETIYSIGLNASSSSSALLKIAAPHVVGMYYTPIPPFDITWTKITTPAGYKLNHRSGVALIDGGAAGALVMRVQPNVVGYNNNLHYTAITESGFTGLTNSYIISDNVSISAYNQNTARNPLRETKLYTSRYCPIYISDYSCTAPKLIKNELIPDNTTMIAGASFSIVGNPTLWIRFINYDATIEGITDYKNDTSNELPVVADTFADYFSRNTANNIMSFASLIATMGRGTGAFMPAAVNAADAFLAPDVTKSASNSTTPRIARKLEDFIYYYEMPINAVELCDFWALYGYPYNKPATLSSVLNTRYRFNYVKTSDAKLPSIAYAEHKKKVEALFDAGVTFWHNRAGTYAAIRNYSKENAEMSLL